METKTKIKPIFAWCLLHKQEIGDIRTHAIFPSKWRLPKNLRWQRVKITAVSGRAGK